MMVLPFSRPRTKPSNNSKRLSNPAKLAIVIPPLILCVIVGMLLSDGFSGERQRPSG